MVDDRLIKAAESIAESLKLIAEKPPVTFTLEMTDDLNRASENLRDLILADETRNKRVQKYCSFCGKGILVEEDEIRPLCDEHSGAGL